MAEYQDRTTNNINGDVLRMNRRCCDAVFPEYMYGFYPYGSFAEPYNILKIEFVNL